MKEIKIVINEDAEVSIDMQGFKGKGCDTLAQKIAKVLGANIKTTKKSEYYVAETIQEQRINRGM